MPHTRLHTSAPRVDPRFPHMAPVLGAQPLVNRPEAVLEGALGDTEPTSAVPTLRSDPWPEVAVGVGTAAFSGAVTGGVAAGSWTGAGIGAGISATFWSGFTLLSSYRELGPRARGVLAASATVGALMTGGGLWLRSRRRTR